MSRAKAKGKIKEWLRHYVIAELLGTLIALAFAWATYAHTHSYAAAAGAGFVGEGIGFYGYFITTELWKHGLRTQGVPFHKRLAIIFTSSSTNLLVEFAPAELFDNIFIRPFAMYLAPQYIKPYALGFIAGKFIADILFYTFAILGYETRKRWLKH
ncbi:MAG TPA: hypothetical protein VN554_00840 [Verrucomicrobiae bacterium]|nr:hypothetical protein [Verrucomicrobiae bacterium]